MPIPKCGLSLLCLYFYSPNWPEGQNCLLMEMFTLKLDLELSIHVTVELDLELSIHVTVELDLELSIHVTVEFS